MESMLPPPCDTWRHLVEEISVEIRIMQLDHIHSIIVYNFG